MISEFLIHYKHALGVAYYLCRDKSTAEDIVQHVYYRLVKDNRQISGHLNYKGYISTAVKNTFLNYYKTNKDRWNVNIDETPLKHTLSFPAVNNDLSERVAQALGGVNDILKLPLMLHVVYDFKYNEIAKIIEVPIGTVRSRIFMAKKILKKELNARNVHKTIDILK